MRFTFQLSLCLGFFISPFVRGQEASESLSIGSKAPSLNVEHWITDGNGKFKEVKEFAAGQVYVVEFWATWCGPCIMSMPHLVEVQNRFVDKNVQVISISDESLDTVREFLQKPSPSSDAESFGKLTSAYCLTTDPDGSSHRDFMQASGQQGIPTSFIVGKTGFIEWIGHPVVIDEPLEKVVAGTWDREAYKKELEREIERERILEELSAKANRLARDGKLEAGLTLIADNLKENENDATMVSKLQSLSFKLKTSSPYKKLSAGKVAEANAELARVIQEATDEQKIQIAITKCKILTNRYANTATNESHLAESLADLAKMPGVPINELQSVAFGVLHSLDDEKDLPKSVIQAGLQGSERVLSKDGEDIDSIETYCHYAVLSGMSDKAIQVLEKRISNSNEAMKIKLQRVLQEVKSQQ